MKNIRLLLLTLFAAVLPLTAWADGTEVKTFESTFNGATYGIANETYSTGTLSTSEGNNWIWESSGESKSPVLRLEDVGGESCVSAKLRTSEFVMNTEFSVPGKIQKVTLRLGGNIGEVQLHFGDTYSSYTWNYGDNDLHTARFNYEQISLRSTLPNQTVRVVMLPKDASSDEPMYLQNITIETEVLSFDENDIESVFVDFDGSTNTLVAADDAYNWKLALPYGSTTIESYPTMWNNQDCLYMRVTGGNSTYPKLTFTSAFSVLGKVKKIVVRAGGDFRVLSYTKENGEMIWSEDATSNIPYFGEWVLDFGEGIDVHDVLSFDFYTGRNTYLKSVSVVMENGEETEIEGILSTFYDWDEWEVYDSHKTGCLKSKEDTPWQAFVYDPTTQVYSTMLMESDDESTLQQCMVFYNSGNVDFQLMNMFDVSGTIKKIVVRYTGRLDYIEAVINEYGAEEEGRQRIVVEPVLGYDMFSDAELLFDGTTEYTNASIRLFFSGGSPLFLQSITIIQKEDDGGGGNETDGKCGDDLYYAIKQLPYNTWVWDENTNQPVEVPAYKLVITGTGDMYDYDDWGNPTPWADVEEETILEIELPDGITHVGNDAFYGLYRATVNKLPDTLTSIGAYAFYNLLSWASEDLVLPANLTSLGEYAFAYCEGFKNLYLPATLTYIGDCAISSVFYLENYYVDAANPVYVADGNAVIEKATKKLIAGNANTVIPGYVETIGTYAFYSIRADEMVIPSSVRNIGSFSFANSYITKIDIPSSVTSIDRYAFYYCNKLTSVTIGSGVTYVGPYAFHYSTNILDVMCYADPDALTWESTKYDNNSFKPDKMTMMHVRASDLDKWQEKFSFLNVTFVGDLGGTIAPITDETYVAAPSLEGQDLSDTTIDNIYYNLDPSSGNGYKNGGIYISQTTDISLISDGTPGSDDVRDNFTGIILEVAPGKGVIIVNAMSIGNPQLAVRIGDGTPTYAHHNERWETYISYNVTEPTYVYIYAVGEGALVKAFTNEDSDISDNALLIYGITVVPGADADGIENIDGQTAGGNDIYNLAGQKMSSGRLPRGLHIVNGKKVIVK